jgi:DNA-binding transcriptional ArsR family regulator
MEHTRKLYRADGTDTSKEAAYSLGDVTKMEDIVLSVISKHRKEGCISDDVREELSDYSYSSVTARYRALKDKGLIKIDDRKLKGRSGRKQHIMWATGYYEARHEG